MPPKNEDSSLSVTASYEFEASAEGADLEMSKLRALEHIALCVGYLAQCRFEEQMKKSFVASGKSR
jgi:hypothetical protein